MTGAGSNPPQYGPASIFVLQQSAPAPTPIWGPPPPPPPIPMQLSPMNNAQSTPPILQAFSPDSGPKQVVQSCPYAPRSGGGAASSSPPTAQQAPRPKKPCDVKNLKIQVKEPNATDKAGEPLVFETIKAAGSQPNHRPHELGADSKAPRPIASQILGTDLVLEVIAPPSTKGTASFKGGAPASNSSHDVKMAQAKASASASGGTTTLIVASTWSANCADPEHNGILFTPEGEPTQVMGASFTLPIKSKSKSDIGNLWDFVTSGLDPRVLGRRYEIKADSCGVVTKGPATDEVTAIVTAYPPGTTGVKIGYEGFSFGFGWTKADEYKDSYKEKNKAVLESTTSEKLQGKLDKALANQSRISAKRPSGGKKVAQKQKAQLTTARQEVARIKHLLEVKQDEEKSPFSLNIVLFDEEIDPGETYAKAKKAITTVNKAKSTIDGLLNALKFLTTYSPSLVTPIAEIEISLLQFELFVGFKLASDDRYKGTRWRALPRCFDIEANCKALEIKGALGAVIGKRILGTGANIEVLFTPTASISLGAEYSSPNIFTEEAAGWEETKLKAQGEFRGTGSLSGKVTLLWFHIAYASVDANGSGRISTDNKLADIMSDRTEWAWTLTLDPVGGLVTAYVLGMTKPWQYPYELWQGGVWDFKT
jgi:hypothetical protein